MPIRINLLAEQQAVEYQRRRDPVKRATWVAGIFIGLLILWSAYLQFQLMAATREVSRVETEWKKLEPDYNSVVANLNKIVDAEQKWAALQSLASNRFLWANPLNALQYVMVDDVHVGRLRTEQSYTVTQGIKPSTNAAGIVSRGKPATSREKILLTLEARDYSASPGDQIPKLQEAINNQAYFKSYSQKTELTQQSPVQSDGGSIARPFVFFSLEFRFPEKVR